MLAAVSSRKSCADMFNIKHFRGILSYKTKHKGPPEFRKCT